MGCGEIVRNKNGAGEIARKENGAGEIVRNENAERLREGAGLLLVVTFGTRQVASRPRL